jgi:octaprenyl-diphosphate synthase
METWTTAGDPADPREQVLAQLAAVCRARDHAHLAERLAALKAFIDDDLAAVEADLATIELGTTPMHRSARHLLALAGKRIRPMCVALAARIGSGFSPVARQLAVAVELVHNATLLHDDVVDLGDARRGAPAARLVYGNAASIFGGDFLLVEALDRIERAGFPELLARAIAVLKEMLEAEALQLANRGSVGGGVRDYFRVVAGKTASLFRWALYAGGRAGALPREQCNALESFGAELGTAFQLTDDLLDLAGDPVALGKSLFADVREGKMTYPLLLALERDASLGARFAEACARGGDGAESDAELFREVVLAVRRTGALEQASALATSLAERAVAALADVPAGRARDALVSVAISVARRQR